MIRPALWALRENDSRRFPHRYHSTSHTETSLAAFEHATVFYSKPNERHFSSATTLLLDVAMFSFHDMNP